MARARCLCCPRPRLIHLYLFLQVALRPPVARMLQPGWDCKVRPAAPINWREPGPALTSNLFWACRDHIHEQPRGRQGACSLGGAYSDLDYVQLCFASFYQPQLLINTLNAGGEACSARSAAQAGMPRPGLGYTAEGSNHAHHVRQWGRWRWHARHDHR